MMVYCQASLSVMDLGLEAGSLACKTSGLSRHSRLKYGERGYCEYQLTCARKETTNLKLLMLMMLMMMASC